MAASASRAWRSSTSLPARSRRPSTASPPSSACSSAGARSGARTTPRSRPGSSPRSTRTLRAATVSTASSRTCRSSRRPSTARPRPRWCGRTRAGCGSRRTGFADETQRTQRSAESAELRGEGHEMIHGQSFLGVLGEPRRSRRWKGTWRWAGALALVGASSAAAAPPAKPGGFKLPLETKKLGNGLTVVVSEDHSSPTFGISIAYRIGFRLEPKGRTGFAHLFEHMMFEGTPVAAKGTLARVVEGGGGVLNGSTRYDYTNYIASAPVSALDAILWLEA